MSDTDTGPTAPDGRPYEVEVTIKWRVETWMVDYYNWQDRDVIDQMGEHDHASIVYSWIENMELNAVDSARDDGWVTGPVLDEAGETIAWTATPPEAT